MMETTSAPPGSSTVTSVFTAPGAMCLTRPFKVFRALICIERPPHVLGLQDPEGCSPLLLVYHLLIEPAAGRGAREEQHPCCDPYQQHRKRQGCRQVRLQRRHNV